MKDDKDADRFRMSPRERSSMSVKRVDFCEETGEISGLQEIISHFGIKHPEEHKELEQEIAEYITDMKTTYEVDEELLEERKEVKILKITNCSNDREEVITVERDDETGEVEYIDLPADMVFLLTNFHDEEKWDDPIGVMKSIVTMHAAL